MSLFDLIFHYKDGQYVDLNTLTSFVDIRTNRYITNENGNEVTVENCNQAMEKDIIKSRLKIPFFVNESNEQRPIYICSNHRNFILSNHNSDCCSICGKHSSVQPTNGQSIYTNYNENVSPLKLSYRYVSIFSK